MFLVRSVLLGPLLSNLVELLGVRREDRDSLGDTVGAKVGGVGSAGGSEEAGDVGEGLGDGLRLAAAKEADVAVGGDVGVEDLGEEGELGASVVLGVGLGDVDAELEGAALIGGALRAVDGAEPLEHVVAVGADGDSVEGVLVELLELLGQNSNRSHG